MASVYIETTIPSYYFETRTEPRIVAWREATREWWDKQRQSYELVTSEYVLTELGRAPAPKARKCADLLSEARILEDPASLMEVAEYYIAHRLMPDEAGGDAVHLAMASLQGVDFLLTWNCRHLANANKAQHVAVLNGRLGLPVPVVTTPYTLMPETG